MNVRKKTISGVKWTAVSTVTLAVSALLKISVLARFLDASDFGLMALVTFVLGFMDLFMDMGLTSAILHKQNITKEEYASLYWLNVCFSFLLFFIIAFFLGPVIADFYSELELKALIPLAGVAIIFSAIGKQYKTILQKNLEFKKIAIVDITAVVIALAIAIILAIKGYGVYALVYSALAQYGISNVVYFVIENKRQHLLFHFNYNETKPFLKIGMYQVGGQVVNYFNRDLDILIIGKFFGADLLGGYSLAKQLVRRPISIIDPIINKVAISILPRYQSDNVSLLKYFQILIQNLSIINAFVYGAIAISASTIITILYGEKYLDIVSLVQIFTIVVYFRSISGLVGVLSITKGRTDIEFYWNIIVMIVFPIAIISGCYINVFWTIAFIGFVQMLLILPSWSMFYKKLLNMPFLEYHKLIYSPFVISIIVFLGHFFINHNNVIFQIIWTSMLFVILLIYGFLTSIEIRTFIIKKSNKHVKFFIRNK